MNFGDTMLDAMVDEIAKAGKDPVTGYVHRKNLVDSLEELLRKPDLHVSIASRLVRQAAAANVDRYFNRRKPKKTAQESIYFPEFWLPLGDGRRVQMCDASGNDLVTYRRLVKHNEERVKLKGAVTYDYVDQRVAALDSNPGRLLGWVEVHVFGYRGIEGDPEEYLTEDDTDDLAYG